MAPLQRNYFQRKSNKGYFLKGPLLPMLNNNRRCVAALVVASSLLLCSCSAVGVPLGVACGDPQHDAYPFCDVSLPIAERVADLVSRVRSEDKAALLTARGWPQGNVTALPYLGVPAYDWGLNCVHGVQSTCVNGTCPTSFPNPNGLGATWNASNVLWMGMKIGLEARALWLAGAREPSLWSGMAHIGLNCWSPNININRDPRWGRNQEVPSEDPLLAADYAKAYTSGIQNNPAVDPETIQALVTLKHWAAYSMDNSDGETRYNFNAVVSPFDLSDTYLRAFRAGVVEADAKGIMCSYNSLNGVPTCASPFLKEKLRGEWNFTGYVTSDTDSVECIYEFHKYTLSPANATCLALRDGETDINSGGTYFTYLAQGVSEGLCSEADVDRALTNTMTLRFQLGLFDGKAAGNRTPPFWSVPLSVVNDNQGKAQSLFAAQQSLVLLQNRNNVLPLVGSGQRDTSTNRTIRVGWIGPSANQSAVMLGNYLGWLCPGGGDDFSCVETPLQAFEREALSLNIRVTYAQGCYHNTTDPTLFQEALDVAASSDVIVFVGGLDESLEAEMLDRTSIALPAAQAYFIGNLSVFQNTPKVLVLFNGGVLDIEDALPVVDSVVEAWYPGPHGGAAVASALLGKYNPGGKLPVTMYRSSYVDLISMSDMNMTTGVGRSYRYLAKNITPLFPFGFGLSYSNFTWSCSASVVWSDNVGRIDCTVVNHAAIDGDDVLQLYMVPPTIHSQLVTVPHKSLVNYTRVHVPSLSSVLVVLTVNSESFCFTTALGSRVAEPGTYTLRAENGGQSQWQFNWDVPFSPQVSPQRSCAQM